MKKKNQWKRTTAFSESEKEREEVEMEMRRKRIGKKGMGILSGKNAAFYLSFVVGIDNSNFYVQAGPRISKLSKILNFFIFYFFKREFGGLN